MNLSNKKVLVFGTGKSGIASANLLLSQKIPFGIYDSNIHLTKELFYQQNPQLDNIDFYSSECSMDTLKQFHVLVISPGIPTDLPFVLQAKKMGLKVIGEIELAFLFGKGRVAAITGTNGKTTTTALLGEILKAYFSQVKVVGNIGIPYTSMASEMTNETVTVAEVSSFQLETIEQFHPVVSAILNISPDHLDRHHTMEAYIEAKKRITMNQDTKDLCVLNYEDKVLREFGESLSTKVCYFSSLQKLKCGVFLDQNKIFYRENEEDAPILVCETKELNLLGLHNYENVMAATAMAIGFNVPISVISLVLKEFQSVEHRIEYVANIKSVSYYNDSKGTNPDAAIKGIMAMNRPTYLIAGGYDKDSDFSTWIQSFNGKVKKLVLLGQTKEKIAQAATKEGFLDFVFTESLEEAVAYCKTMAVEGEAVLLSPACASWGMFRDYEERGRVFKQLVIGQKE